MGVRLKGRIRCVRFFTSNLYRVVRERWGARTWWDSQEFLAVGLCLSARKAGDCEESITAVEVVEMLSECLGDKSPGLDCLPFEIYKSMPDLFWHQHASVYANWKQNGRIPKAESLSGGDTDQKGPK